MSVKAGAEAVPQVKVSTPSYPVGMERGARKLVTYSITESGNVSGTITSRTYQFYTQYDEPLSDRMGPYPANVEVNALETTEWDELVYLPQRVVDQAYTMREYALVLKTTFLGKSASGADFEAQASLLILLPPAEFGKDSPANGAFVQPIDLSLFWNGSLGAIDYEYCFDIFDNGVCDTEWTGTYWLGTYNTNAALQNVPAGTTFYWQVRANNMAGTTYANNGTWWSFQTACYNKLIIVTNTNDSGAGSLRQAIADLCPGGIINFDPSLSGQTIILNSTLLIYKDLTIDGSALDPQIKISGNYTVTVFQIPVGFTVTLNNLNIVDGSAVDAVGGILNGGTLNLKNSLVSNNFGRFGGGIQNHGTLNVVNSTFSYNKSFEGGGILNSGILNVTDSTFSDNKADNGAGLASVGTATIANSTFFKNVTGAADSKGAGIYNYGSLTVTNTIFSDNMSEHLGGGIYTSNGPVKITDSTFTSNFSPLGGGMYVDSSSPTLDNVLFTGNSATEAGGMYNKSSNTVLMNVTFVGNSAIYGNAGGMYNNGGIPELTNVVFNNNSAGAGGGMYNNSSSPRLTSVTFNSNTAINGGAMFNITSDPVLSGVTFSNNSATAFSGGSGGGMYNNGSSPKLVNATFSGNTSTSLGAGIFNTASSNPQIINVTFHGNSGTTGSGVYSLNNSYPLIENSIFWNNVNADIEHDTSSLPRVVYSVVEGNYYGGGVYPGIGNLNTDPLLGPLQNNGGFTRTMALLPGSSAIDSGYAADCPAADQRGVARPRGSGCDIGAFEAEVVATPTPTSTPPYSYQPLYLSLTGSQTIGGISSANEDILRFDGTSWSRFFDGSDVGLGSLNLFAFSIVDQDTLLMSFSSTANIGGIDATPQDILRFDATSLGDTTAGTFSMYFDGSDVGFDNTSSEKIDSITLLPDGRLLVSTNGSPSVPGLTGGKDEDVLAFTPTSLGWSTSGTWALYFDGSDVGLSEASDEDIDALDVVGANIYLSTLGNFSVAGLSGADEDVFVCAASSTGDVTACNYSSSHYFDGSTWGLTSNDVDAFNVLNSGPVPTATPTLPPTATLTPTPGAPVTLTLTPEVDARVSEASPTSNYGNAATLLVDAGSGAAETSYLRFVASGLNGSIQSARLRVYCTTNGSTNGPAAYLASNVWTETGITWNTQPALLSGAFDNKGAIAAGSWVEYDVTALVTGNGTYTFALVGDSTDGMTFSSSEGSTSPMLVVETMP
jgi:hypothetical protein